ncbi:MAG: OmpA family protein [Alphaproteobacteria bacterium]
MSPNHPVTGVALRLARTLGLVVALAALVTAAPDLARAQGATPDVMVDRSVLDELGPPHAAPPGTAVLKLKPPSPRPATAAKTLERKAAPEKAAQPKVGATAPEPPKQPAPQAKQAPPAARPAKGVAVPTIPVESAPIPPLPPALPPAQAQTGQPGMPTAAKQPPAEPAPAQASLPPATKPIAPAAPTILPLPEPKTAATPKAAAAAPGDAPQVRLLFEGEQTDLPPTAAQALRDVAVRLSQEPGLRLQLLAYAGGGADTANKARRISLSRALSVRSFLLSEGVSSARIDVRALGNSTQETPADRVDLLFVRS